MHISNVFSILVMMPSWQLISFTVLVFNSMIYFIIYEMEHQVIITQIQAVWILKLYYHHQLKLYIISIPIGTFIVIQNLQLYCLKQ